MLKAFLSSTIDGLERERQAAREAILAIGLEPVMFEVDWGALPEPPIEACRRMVGSADMLVLLLGPRYGFVLPDGRSPTRLEYEHAVELGTPIFVYTKTLPKDSRQQAWEQAVGDFERGYAWTAFSHAAELGDRIKNDLQRFVDQRFRGPHVDWVFERYCRAYLKQVIARYADYERRYIPYAPLTASPLPGTLWDRLASRRSDDLLEWLDDARRSGRRLLIVGDAGSGKTFTLRRAVRDCARNSLEALAAGRPFLESHLPILVRLGAYRSVRGAPREHEILDLLLSGMRECAHVPASVSAERLETYFDRQPLFLALDGFDEIAEADVGAAVDALKAFLERYPKAAAVFTSRAAFADPGRDLLQVHLRVEPVVVHRLSRHRIEAYLRDTITDGATRERLRERLADVRLATLAQKPLFLFVIVRTLDRPSARFSRMLAEFARLSLEIDVAGRYPRLGRFTLDLKHAALCGVAAGAEKSGAAVFTEDHAADRLKARPELVTSDARRALLHELVDNGVLERVGGDRLRFWHPSLQSYFAGCALYDETIGPYVASLAGSDRREKSARRRKVLAVCGNPRWTEATAFAFGQVTDQDGAADLLATIMDVNTVLAGKAIGQSDAVPADLVERFATQLRSEFVFGKTDFVTVVFYSLTVFAVAGLLLGEFGLVVQIGAYRRLAEWVGALLAWDPVLDGLLVLVLLAVVLELARLAVNSYLLSRVLLPTLVTLEAMNAEAGSRALKEIWSALTRSRLPVVPGVEHFVRLFQYRSHPRDDDLLEGLRDAEDRLYALESLREIPKASAVAETIRLLAAMSDRECRVALDSLRAIRSLLPESADIALAAVVRDARRFRLATRRQAWELLRELGDGSVPPPRYSVYDAVAALRRTAPLTVVPVAVMMLVMLGAVVTALSEVIETSLRGVVERLGR
jgi:hypothetical protein